MGTTWIQTIINYKRVNLKVIPLIEPGLSFSYSSNFDASLSGTKTFHFLLHIRLASIAKPGKGIHFWKLLFLTCIACQGIIQQCARLIFLYFIKFWIKSLFISLYILLVYRKVLCTIFGLELSPQKIKILNCFSFLQGRNLFSKDKLLLCYWFHPGIIFAVPV